MSRDELRVPSQERAIRTRAALVDAARRAFSEKGYAATTAKTVAERADVSTGSFYQYFRDKDQLLHELAADRYEHVARMLDGSLAGGGETPTDLDAVLRDRMGRLVQVVIDFHRDDPGLHAVLTERRHADTALDELTARSEEQLVERIATLLTLLGHRGDTRALAFVLFGMVEGTVHAHVLGRPMVDDERLVHSLVHSLVVLLKAG